jgi:hypothetical protein
VVCPSVGDTRPREAVAASFLTFFKRTGKGRAKAKRRWQSG